MRLYEVAGNQFQDDLANVLRVMQGQANDQMTTSVITWPAINHMMMMQGYGDVNQNILEKIRDRIDPNGELIQDISEKGIILKTDVASPDNTEVPLGGVPEPKSVDRMAHNVISKGL